MIRNSTKAISYNTKVYRLNWGRLKFMVLIVALLQLAATGTYAQAIKITGHVTDNKNQALPGVSIVVKGTKAGTFKQFLEAHPITNRLPYFN